MHASAVLARVGLANARAVASRSGALQEFQTFLNSFFEIDQS